MIIFIIYMTCIAIALLLIFSKSSHLKKSDPSPAAEKNHRRHSPQGEYGENHVDRIDLKKLKHTEPEPGYVVLNGVKRKSKTAAISEYTFFQACS